MIVWNVIQEPSTAWSIAEAVAMSMPRFRARQAHLQGPRHDAADRSIIDGVLPNEQGPPHASLVARSVTPGVVPEHSAHNRHPGHRGLNPAQQVSNLHKNRGF